MVANMVTGREASPQGADSFLSKVFQSTDQHLNAFQQLSALFEGIINQKGDQTPGVSWLSLTLLGIKDLELPCPTTSTDEGCIPTAVRRSQGKAMTSLNNHRPQ